VRQQVAHVDDESPGNLGAFAVTLSGGFPAASPTISMFRRVASTRISSATNSSYVIPETM
jgi:hypothetical protein